LRKFVLDLSKCCPVLLFKIRINHQIHLIIGANPQGQIGIFIAILIPLIGFYGTGQTLPSFSKTRDKFR